MSHPSWKISSLLISSLVAIPISVILLSFLKPQLEIWVYLWNTQLPELIWNTLSLTFGVGAGTLLLGTSLAWFVVMYDFPAKIWIEGALLLPLAVPGYVIGFVVQSQWAYYGAIPTFFRETLGVLWFPQVSSYPGIVIVLSLVLYPYVYLAARTAFREQNQTLLEAARMLKARKFQVFSKVAVPLARPSIVAGISLVLMETLADFGTVGIFSYNTFTTAIYETWYGLFEKQAALQLAGILLLFSLCLFYFELKTRGKAKYYQIQGNQRPLTLWKVQGWKRWGIVLYPLVVLGAAFVYPISVLLYWTSQGIAERFDAHYWNLVKTTLSVALVSAVIILSIALVLAYSKRILASPFLRGLTRFSCMGYALPGSVIALGVLVPLAWLDHRLNDWTQQWFGTSVGLIFTGSVMGLVFAYTVRFLMIAFNYLDSSLLKITLSMDAAAQIMGKGQRKIFFKIHLPLIKGSLLVGFVIVFVDIMKEMPATLLIRPFGHETLATQIWQLTAESYWEDAALPALTIVLVELIPVFLLIYLGKKSPILAKGTAR